MKEKKNIGIDVRKPKESCNDKNCPFHGNLKVRGRSFKGTVVSDKMKGTITVKWVRKYFIPKYERFEKRYSKVKAHNPPCINAQEGDFVKIIECRPLSKTKNFVVVEKSGKDIDYLIKESEAEEKVNERKKEEKTEQEIKENTEEK